MTSGREPRAPRSSAQVVRSSLDELHSRRKRHARRRTVLGLALLVGLVWGANQLLVGRPVQAALASDPRTAAIGMVGHFDRYVIPTTLILDLQRPAVADTNDLLRGLLAAANGLQSLGMLDRIVLARAGTPVYALSGDDFRKLGRDLTIVPNQVLVLRALAAALRLPGGQKPPPLEFPDAARRWATGGP